MQLLDSLPPLTPLIIGGQQEQVTLEAKTEWHWPQGHLAGHGIWLDMINLLVHRYLTKSPVFSLLPLITQPHPTHLYLPVAIMDAERDGRGVQQQPEFIVKHLFLETFHSSALAFVGLLKEEEKRKQALMNQAHWSTRITFLAGTARNATSLSTGSIAQSAREAYCLHVLLVWLPRGIALATA